MSVLNAPEIEKVAPGTTADGNYSFSLKATPETRCEIWGYSGKIQQETIVTPTATEHHTLIMPTDDSLSGNIGCWFYNVGQYYGKTVDVKCTYYWQPLTVSNTKFNPVIDATYTSDVIAFHFAHQSFEVKYELYSEGKPLTVNMSLTFQDIDWTQSFGFKMGTGTLNKIQCRTDATSYYTEALGRKWFYAENIGSDNGPESSVRLEMKDTNCFYIVYGAEDDIWSYPIDRFIQESVDFLIADALDSQKTADYAFTNNSFSDLIERVLGWGFCTAEAYGPYSLPSPVKYVSDTNENLVTTNSVNETETFTYSIYQAIPQENSVYYYSTFQVTDNLPSAVTYQSAAVYNEQDEDVSSLFNISNSNGTITFQLKAPSSADFYNKEYCFTINVKLDKANLSNYKTNNDLYSFTNTATTTIERNGTSSQNSNTVTTNYYIKNLVVNKIWKDNNNANRPESITYTLKRDDVVYQTGTITSDNNWSVNINNLPKYKADGSEYLYTIEEERISLPNGDTYIPSYDGLIITNTLQGTKSLTITKIWQDWDDMYSVRPTSLNITILQNGKAYQTITLSASDAVSGDSNSWRKTINNVPKYDSNGALYTYTIQEDMENENIKYFYVTPTYDQSTLTVTNRAIYVPPVTQNGYLYYVITVKKEIINNDNQKATALDFEKLKLDINSTYQFPIVLKEMNRTVSKVNNQLVESYSGYSGKTYQGIVTNKGDIVFNNIPAGKYEISENAVQYFNFVSIEKLDGTTGVTFSYENGKYYITISGLTASDEDITVKVTNKINSSRPYDEKDSENNFFKQ